MSMMERIKAEREAGRVVEYTNRDGSKVMRFKTTCPLCGKVELRMAPVMNGSGLGECVKHGVVSSIGGR